MLKRIAIILLLFFLLVVPAVAQDDDECTGVRCEENATAILCKTWLSPIWFGVVAFALRRK